MIKTVIEKLGITPAPWRFIEGKKIHHITSDTAMIIKTNRDPVVLDRTWDRQTRDHQLIASAPDMLEALIEQVGLLENSEFQKSYEKLKRVVEKATDMSWEEVKEIIKK